MKTPTPLRTTTPCGNTVPAITVGIDLGDKRHAVCALDNSGNVIEQSTIANQSGRLRKLSEKFPGARIVIEVGSHSPWISRLFESMGHEVFVANARKVRAIYTNTRKCDQIDAMMLARLGRMDPGLLHPIRHRCEQAQRDLLQIKLRDNLVRQRVNIIAGVRGALKSLGITPARANSRTFADKTASQLGECDAALLSQVMPALLVIDTLTGEIRGLDRLCPATIKNSLSDN